MVEKSYMRSLFRIPVLGGALLLSALIAWGCSSDSGADQAAAAQLLESDLQIQSPNFTQIRPRVRIPDENTCYGEGVSPPLNWSQAPDGTKSFAMIGEDADHDTGIWVHWVIYNIPADSDGLPEDISTSTEVLPDGTTQGINDHRSLGYQGPCPKRSILAHYNVARQKPELPHSYYFRLFALDIEGVDLGPRATKAELVNAMSGHILAQAETVGKYQAEPIVLQNAEKDRNRD